MLLMWGIRIGDIQSGTTRIVSPYMDDRIVCVLLKVLESIRDSKNDLYFVFSSQEEVGIRGAKTAAFSIERM